MKRDYPLYRSPLYETHNSFGAAFAEFHGWEIPSNYGNPAAEHLAVRSNAGIMDMTHRGKILISGEDRTKFLQNILSQDISKLTPGSGGHSTLLNTKGHMLAYMRIYSDGESFLIDTESGETDKILQTLNRYLFREDVKVEDVTLRYGLITVNGPNSRKIISAASGTEINDMPDCSHVNITINGINCRAVRTAYTGEEGYDIYTPWDDLCTIWETILSAGIASKIPLNPPFSKGEISSPPLVKGGEGGFCETITTFGLDAFETLRIEAGTPVYMIDMDENTIPIEANLDHAISYTKGCYVGQETIARIKFKGHVNRILTGLSITSGTEINSVPDISIIPRKGDRIFRFIDNTEQDIGFITSACISPSLKKIIALGYIKTGYNEPGLEVSITCGSEKLTAGVSRLPFLSG
ncbi:MAG: aminomethyltransferase family protein [Nitrospirae bacterium]|nr:aminomethyltransferase family protein [Nitrospirota bacterium]